MSVSVPVAIAQRPDGGLVRGTVLDSAGKPVGDASVRLEHEGVLGAAEAKTDAAGIFVFSALPAGSYELSAEKAGQRSRFTAVSVGPSREEKQLELVLVDSAPAMEFADKPNFTVAGVTDWTAVGGHGSDSSLRTSEALARETLTLKPDGSGDSAPGFQ